MGKCKICDGNALPGQEYCLMCRPNSPNPGSRDREPGRDSRRGPGGGPGRRSYPPNRGIPDKCIFKDSFYSPDGYLKSEVNIEAAAEMARVLEQEDMTQTSIRALFNFVKSIEQRLKSQRELGQGFIRENFSKFVTQVEYQLKRGVIKQGFKSFVDAHLNLALKSEKEFEGFIAYLTAIVARMKQ